MSYIGIVLLNATIALELTVVKRYSKTLSKSIHFRDDHKTRGSLLLFFFTFDIIETYEFNRHFSHTFKAGLFFYENNVIIVVLRDKVIVEKYGKYIFVVVIIEMSIDYDN